MHVFAPEMLCFRYYQKKFGPFVDQPNDVADAYSRNQPTPTDLTDGKIADQPTASVKSGTDADWASW